MINQLIKKGGIMKSSLKRVFCALLVIFVAVLPVMAQGSGESQQQTSGPIDIKIATWTSNQDQLDLLGSFVDEFAAKEGMEINATFESITFDEYNTLLSLELQGSEAPDVFWVLETSAPAFIESGLLAPLDEELAEYNPDDFSPKAMELWQKDGVTYAVPFSTSPFFVIYNADLFAQAGIPTPADLVAEGNWNWDTFRQSSKAIKDATGVWGFQTVDGGGYDARILHNLCPIIRSYGGDAWTNDGQILINSPESVEAVQLFHDMVYVDGSVVPPGDQSNFFAGAAGMTVAQVSRVSNLAEADFAWGVAPMPAGPMGDVPVIGQAGIGAYSRGKNVDIAKKLVAYMTNEECVARMAGIWPPARYSVLESDDFLSSQPLLTAEQMDMAVGSSIETGRVLPSHVMYPQIEVESRIVWDRLWNADADVKAVLDAVAQVYANYIN